MERAARNRSEEIREVQLEQLQMMIGLHLIQSRCFGPDGLRKQGFRGGRMKYYVSFAVAIGATALAACATTFKPVPDGYQGPTAILKDSSRAAPGDKCGDFFVLYDYNGKEVDNAMQASARDNVGSGPVFSVVKEFSRPVPARTATIFIAGRTHCAAPMMELVGTVHLVGGKVEFTPEADAVYVVKGELTEDHSAVWIEDERNNLQVSNKLLIKGPAPAGFFGIKGKVEEIPPPH
jgi:hypothetical protein